MSYSIVGSGQQNRRQAVNTFGQIAGQERQRNHANKQIEQSEKDQRTSAVGTAGGMAARQVVPKVMAANAAKKAAVDMAGKASADAYLTAGMAKGSTATMAATTGGTAATTGAAVGTGAAAGGTAAGGGGILAAMGPVGWAVGAGLLVASLF